MNQTIVEGVIQTLAIVEGSNLDFFLKNKWVVLSTAPGQTGPYILERSNPCQLFLE